MDKQGLVAPVWSDAGEVKEAPNFCAGPLWDTYEVSYDDILSFALQFKGISEAKPSDPNAKPALPALTRVSGNKRGPGWCDEGGA